MPLVLCPKCRIKLNVPDAMAGKKAKCTKCQTVFVVPGASAAVRKPGPPVRPQPLPLPAPARSPAPIAGSKKLPTWVLIAAVGGLLFFCIASSVASWFLLIPRLWPAPEKVAADDDEPRKRKKRPKKNKKSTNPVRKSLAAPNSWSATLKAGAEQITDVEFHEERPAAIDVTVIGVNGPRPPVELIVTDGAGTVIAADRLNGSSRFATFVPPRKQVYTVSLVNKGSGTAQCSVNVR